MTDDRSRLLLFPRQYDRCACGNIKRSQYGRCRACYRKGADGVQPRGHGRVRGAKQYDNCPRCKRRKQATSEVVPRLTPIPFLRGHSPDRSPSPQNERFAPFVKDTGRRVGEYSRVPAPARGPGTRPRVHGTSTRKQCRSVQSGTMNCAAVAS